MRLLYVFENDYCVSVVDHNFGEETGFFEILIGKVDGMRLIEIGDVICGDKKIWTSQGRLTQEELNAVLEQVKALEGEEETVKWSDKDG